MTINACLKSLHPLVKCDHQCFEWTFAQNLNHRLKKLICSLKFSSLEQSFYMAKEKKGRSVLGLGSKVDVAHSSDCSHRNLISFFLQHVACHYQRAPPIFVDLLRRE
jgi:hypothetical protein